MSDFDKEAEREKLREKYERDQEERKATQRMSDLLLKGATMTNAHCGTCGDPLFQMDGTTFCPSCHGNPDAVEGTDLEAQPADDQPAADGSTGEQPPADRSADDRDAVSAETPTTAASDTPATERDANSQRPSSSSATPSQDERQPASPSDGGSAGADAASPTADSRASDAGTPSRSPASPSRPADGDLEAARDALVRTLETFATEAAATDDPRYARECLEAAREAGEALSTLR